MISETFTAEPEERDDTLDDGEPEGPTPLAQDDPVHLAKCAECATAVRYRANVTGTGFFLVDEAPDVTFGVGDNGRPICPNGHGEMSIADDQLKPIAEAFADAQTMLQNAEGGPVQRSLPGVFPAFNFEGAYMELEQQAIRVDSLHKAHKAAAEEARDAKKAWDSAAELYTTMALELRRRRRDKEGEPQDAADRQAASVAGGEPTPRCTWEAKRTTHAEDDICPICSGKALSIVVAQYLGDLDALAPPDAQGHAADVDRLLLAMEVDEVVQALENIDTYITADVVATWTEAERKAVTLWADATLDKTANVPDIVVPERPSVLGKPHIPAKAMDGEHQVCSLCEVVIHAASDETHDPYRGTDYVGVDCAGQPGKVGHHYPKSKKKAPAKKAGKKKGARASK